MIFLTHVCARCLKYVTCNRKLFFNNLNFLQQNKNPQKKGQKKNLFQDSHALRIACATEGSLDHCCVSRRSGASQVYVHSLVIDLGHGTFVASAHLSPFFSSLHLSSLFCQCLPSTLLVLFQLFLLISSLHLFFKIKMFMAENSFFLFSFLCFYSHFPNVFLVKEI